MFNGPPETQRKERDAGEEEPAAANLGDQEALRRDLRDGPPPGWRRSGETAVKGAGAELEERVDEAMIDTYGGDADRDIPDHIILFED